MIGSLRGMIVDNMIFASEVCAVMLIAPFDKISRPPYLTIRFFVFLSLFFRCFPPFSLYHRTSLLSIPPIRGKKTGDFPRSWITQYREKLLRRYLRTTSSARGGGCSTPRMTASERTAISSTRRLTGCCMKQPIPMSPRGSKRSCRM